jgi:hypothetical protein
VGECTIHVYDVFAGDTSFVRDYALTEDRHLAIYHRTRRYVHMINKVVPKT